MKVEAARRLAKAERVPAQAMQLVADEAPEATIHLSYYAMLHAAAAVLIERQGRAPKTHGAIIWQFAETTRRDGEEGRSLSRALNRAEDTRLLSDYGDDSIPDAADALQTRDAAATFVGFCRSLL